MFGVQDFGGLGLLLRCAKSLGCVQDAGLEPRALVVRGVGDMQDLEVMVLGFRRPGA